MENEYYGDFALSTSDGHDEDWEFFETEAEALTRFESLKGYEDDIHLYKYSAEYGYEVIDSYCNEEL